MKNEHSAKTQITIHASTARVWEALTRPALVKRYMMGADVHSDWKVGSPLTYTGEYQGHAYEEKGVIQAIEKEKLLSATHFSSMSGKEDKPENYHLVTYRLHEEEAGKTVVTVTQEGIESAKSAEKMTENWRGVLKGLKETAEG